MVLLGKRYTTDMIRYPNIEVNYMLLSQVIVDDCAKMARAFLLCLLRPYLFANRGQTVSLRWLAPFYDFRGARETN